MSHWPDDKQPRYIIDERPSVRVLDRAYCHRIVREWGIGSEGQKFGARRDHLVEAAAVAAELNREDAAA